MKFKTLLIPLISAGILSTTGCTSDKRARITYGTLVDQEATELTYGSLKVKVNNKENLLLAVYQDNGHPCGCWDSQFKPVINQYVREYHTKVYYIGRSEFTDVEDTFGLTIIKDDSTNPTFALIKNGKKTNEFIYSTDNNQIFSTLDGFRKTVTKIAKDPQYFYIDQAYLDNALFTEKVDKAVVHYIWNFCPDCNYCFPKVLLPYTQNNDFKTDVWIIDLGIPGILLGEDGSWVGTNNESYVTFLKEHKLSEAGDETFGYDRGFVPSTQVWEKGELKDMNVYFNDAVEKVDGKYQLSRTYYTKDRVANLGYTNTVLEDIEINDLEVEVSENTVDGQVVESYSWKKEYANKHHQPILEAFLDKYVK